MTESELIRHIKTTKKFPKTFDDYLNYFSFIYSIAFIAMGAVTGYFNLKNQMGMIGFLISFLFIAIGISFSLFT